MLSSVHYEALLECCVITRDVVRSLGALRPRGCTIHLVGQIMSSWVLYIGSTSCGSSIVSSHPDDRIGFQIRFLTTCGTPLHSAQASRLYNTIGGLDRRGSWQN